MKTYQFNPNKSQNEDIIILDVDFETVNECETYGRYGQIVGCYNAGCYSIDNSACDFVEDLIKAINEKFHIDCDTSIYFDNLTDILDELELTDEKIKTFAEKWIEEETVHTECSAYTYFDGSNWQTLTVSCQAEPDLVEVDESLNKKILEEYETCDFFEYKNGVCEEETENYIFTKTQFSYDYTVATVEIK